MECKTSAVVAVVFFFAAASLGLNMKMQAEAAAPSGSTCPADAFSLDMCIGALNGMFNMTIGDPPIKPCCSLIKGLVEYEAATCLCIAFKTSIFGYQFSFPMAIAMIFNSCGSGGGYNYGCA